MRVQFASSFFLLSVVGAASFSGCQQATGSEESVPRAMVDDDGQPRGTYKIVERPPQASSAEREAMTMCAAPARRTLFLNRRGGTYSGGYDDAAKNRSSIVSGSAKVPAYEKGDASWTQFMACVRGQFGRFNVEVTDVDPGETTHIECVVGGRPGHVGMGSGVGGVAPMNGDCSVVERAVVYVFSQQFSSAQVECEVAAQEIGHALRDGPRVPLRGSDDLLERLRKEVVSGQGRLLRRRSGAARASGRSGRRTTGESACAFGRRSPTMAASSPHAWSGSRRSAT
jgi:hypothetical protein